MINLQEIRSAPKLHLFNYIQLDSAALYASFIKSVYETFCFATPASVKLTSHGEYHLACATDCYLKLDDALISTIPSDYEAQQGLVNWLFIESLTKSRHLPNPLLPFQGLALVIFLTEWCITDISANGEHFRQAFYQGQAVTPCERRASTELPNSSPFIQLQFALAAPQFRSRVITPVQLRQAFASLKEYKLVPKNLRLTSIKLTEDGFETKVKPFLRKS